MQRQDIASNFGPGVPYVKFTVLYSDLAAFTTAGAHALTLLANPGGNAINPANFQVPQGGTPMFSRINVTTAFTGGSISAITVSAGSSGTSNAIQAASSCFTTGCFDKHGMNSELNANTAFTVVLNFTPTGDVLSNLTAGQLDFYMAYLNVSTPSA